MVVGSGCGLREKNIVVFLMFSGVRSWHPEKYLQNMKTQH